MLNSRQVAYLMGWDPKAKLPEGVLPEPNEEGLWTFAQIQEVMSTKERGKSTNPERIKLRDDELLTTRQAAELHYPKPIQETTFSSYVRRIRRKEAAGDVVLCPPPQPIKTILGHPLWHPYDLGKYLAERPGAGYHVSGDARKGYRGGRVPKAKLELVDAVG